ncbi:hypothetical protein [Streptomyces sp. NPDC046862]|uniref:hypothetical protein n=1 Tax=Streptomyces sp. NPDC046862 TaxID=3154603 RepID=UPI0034527F5F
MVFDLRTEAEMRLHSEKTAKELALKKQREESGEKADKQTDKQTDKKVDEKAAPADATTETHEAADAGEPVG